MSAMIPMGSIPRKSHFNNWLRIKAKFKVILMVILLLLAALLISYEEGMVIAVFKDIYQY